jgi:hypothetical protein
VGRKRHERRHQHHHAPRAGNHGGLLRVSAGDQESAMSARYGAAFGDDGDDAFRVYAKGFNRGPSELEGGESAAIAGRRRRPGFAWTSARQAPRIVSPRRATISMRTKTSRPLATSVHAVRCAGRWEYTGERASTRLQFFADHTDRDQPPAAWDSNSLPTTSIFSNR